MYSNKWVTYYDENYIPKIDRRGIYFTSSLFEDTIQLYLLVYTSFFEGTHIYLH